MRGAMRVTRSRGAPAVLARSYWTVKRSCLTSRVGRISPRSRRPGGRNGLRSSSEAISYAFDLLYLDGHDPTMLGQHEHRHMLEDCRQHRTGVHCDVTCLFECHDQYFDTPLMNTSHFPDRSWHSGCRTFAMCRMASGDRFEKQRRTFREIHCEQFGTRVHNRSLAYLRPGFCRSLYWQREAFYRGKRSGRGSIRPGHQPEPMRPHSLASRSGQKTGSPDVRLK